MLLSGTSQHFKECIRFCCGQFSANVLWKVFQLNGLLNGGFIMYGREFLNFGSSTALYQWKLELVRFRPNCWKFWHDGSNRVVVKWNGCYQKKHLDMFWKHVFHYSKLEWKIGNHFILINTKYILKEYRNTIPLSNCNKCNHSVKIVTLRLQLPFTK